MKEMTLIEHLEEFRKTAIHILVIIIVAFIVTYALSDQVAEIILMPLRGALKINGGQIIYLGLLDKITAQLELGLWCGVMISSPLWFFEIWRFIRPGLHDYEVRMVKPFLLFGLFLFWSGVAFAYFVVFPFGFKMMMEYGVTNVVATIALREYLSMAVKILVFFGLAFQMPNVLIILGFMGIVNKKMLNSSRRYIYVILSILAAVFSPPDVFSMMVVWIPSIVLFEVGVLAVTLFVHPYLARQKAAGEEEKK